MKTAPDTALVNTSLADKLEAREALLRESDDFKFNVALVSIDFLIRRGLVGPDEPGFQEICWTLRSGGP